MSVGEPWESLDRYLAGELSLDELLEVVSLPFDERSVPDAVAAQLRGLASPPAEVNDRARWAAAVGRDAYDRGRPGRLVADRAARLARGIVDGSINPAAGARALARLRNDGAAWIPEAFTGIVVALDARPAPRAGVASRLAGERATAATLRPAIIVAARRLLESVGAE